MTPRRLPLALLAAALAAVAIVASLDAHDLFLRPRDFVVKPGDSVQVRVLNGTFTSSEAVVDPARLLDLTVAGPAGIQHPDRAAWTGAGKESSWRVGLGAPGTYLLGASLAPKTIRLSGKQFRDYLREDGLPDMLAARKAAGLEDTPAHERYAKHVKALVHVTGPTTASDTAYRLVLGYPAELVPLANPYALKPGESLTVLALVDGQPIARQVVLSGGRTPGGKVIAERRVRTDARGRASVRLSARGTWYVKFIRMVAVPASARDSVTHESKWATLTFAMP